MGTTFGPMASQLLRQLPTWTAGEYDTQKGDLVTHLVDPARLLVEEVGERLRDGFAPALSWRASVRGSISPFVKDLRFAKDAAVRHHDTLHLTWWDGQVKQGAPTLWFRLAADGVGFASGLAIHPKGLGKWRAWAATDEATPLLRAIASVESKGMTADEPELKGVPAGYEADHAHADLLRRKQLQWRVTVPGVAADDPGLADLIVDRLTAFAPLHTALTGVPR